MPPLPPTIIAWFERHREKLTDASLLVVALNLRGMLLALAPTPWTAQVVVLAIFAALASPRAHLTKGTWARYRQFLPGYLAIAITSVAVPAGSADVVLRYVAPAGLAGAFWISLGAIAAGAAVLLAAGARQLTAQIAPIGSPAASGR
ncbi:MAG TPA: hypothetical protein VF388_08090 [Lacunisphaera sp.]